MNVAKTGAGAVLPPIPAKRYFVIGEVAQLCAVKAHVLRYWEQEFVQLKPIKRRGNRRYYQHHEVLMVRKIRELLYDQGFTIQGARNFLGARLNATTPTRAEDGQGITEGQQWGGDVRSASAPVSETEVALSCDAQWLERELTAIQGILRG